MYFDKSLWPCGLCWGQSFESRWAHAYLFPFVYRCFMASLFPIQRIMWRIEKINYSELISEAEQSRTLKAIVQQNDVDHRMKMSP
jgi:hypothetical protein